MRMPFDGAIDRVDHVERPAGRATMRDVPGADVERKEFRGHTALLQALDVGAIRNRRRPAQVEIVVRHRGRDVVMRIDDDRALLNLERSLPELFIARFSGRRRWLMIATRGARAGQQGGYE